MQAPTQQCAEVLASLALFRKARPAEIERLAGLTRLVHATRGQVLYTKGDPCEGFFVVVYGCVLLSLPCSPGHEKPLLVIERGGSFGDATMMLEEPHVVNARIVDDALLVYLPRSAMVQMIEQSSSFALRLLGSLSLRVRDVVGDIQACSHQRPAARVALYLLQRMPTDASPPAQIELKIRKKLVAAQLNLTPETLSRHFRELSDLGLITLGRVSVTVNQPDQLVDYLGVLSEESARPRFGRRVIRAPKATLSGRQP